MVHKISFYETTCYIRSTAMGIHMVGPVLGISGWRRFLGLLPVNMFRQPPHPRGFDSCSVGRELEPARDNAGIAALVVRDSVDFTLV